MTLRQFSTFLTPFISNNRDKKNHGGGGGKGNWDDLDDGSMDVYDEVAAPTDVSP